MSYTNFNIILGFLFIIVLLIKPNNNNNIHICIAPYGRNFRDFVSLIISINALLSAL